MPRTNELPLCKLQLDVSSNNNYNTAQEPLAKEHPRQTLICIKLYPLVVVVVVVVVKEPFVLICQQS